MQPPMNGMPNYGAMGGTPVSNGFFDASNATPQPKPSGNWFTHLLPTAGAVIGGLLAPETGGLSLLASAGLSGLGSAAGKLAENATEGKGIGDNVATSGIEGGVGGLAGGVLGKAFGKGAEFLGNRAGNITKAATDAEGQIAEQTAAKAAEKSALDEATAIKNNFGGIKPQVQSANDLAGNQDLLKSWGVDHTNPQAMQDASKGGLFINDIHNEALGLGSPIKTTDLLSAKDIVKANPAEQQAFARAGIITPEGGMPPTVTPQQANAFAQDLSTQMRDMQSTMQAAKQAGRVADATDAKAQYDTLKSLYKNVQDVAATPEVNSAIAARTITPAEKATLVGQYGPAQADHIEQAVNNATTHQDLVKAKLPFAQMNNLSSNALEDLKATATTRAAARVKGDLPDIPEVVAPETPSNPLDTLHGVTNGGHASVPNMAINAASHVVNNPKLLSTLARIGEFSAKAAPVVGAAAGTLPNLAADPVAGGGTMGAMNPSMQSPQGMTGAPAPQNDQQSLIDAMRAQSVLAPQLAGQSGATNFLGSIAPMLQKNEAASAITGGIPGAFNNAGGAQGMSGILSRLSGLIPGTAAHTYNMEQEAAAAQLAATLGISPAAAKAMLPQLMQSQGVANQQQGVLGQLQGSLVH